MPRTTPPSRRFGSRLRVAASPPCGCGACAATKSATWSRSIWECRNASRLPAEAIAQIESLSEGNPLFAEELVRTVRESGGLNLATHAPLSLQAMLSERLRRCRRNSERCWFARRSSVAALTPAFLAKIVGLPLERVLGVLQRAVEAGLVVGSPVASLDFASVTR